MNKKSFRKLAGGGIIILWVVMIGLLVKKVHFDTQEEGENTGGQRAVILDSSEQEWMEIFLKDKKVGYSVRSVRPEGEDYRVYRTWTELVGYLRREGGQYRVSRARTGPVGLVEFENTIQVIPLLLSGGAALLLLM